MGTIQFEYSQVYQVSIKASLRTICGKISQLYPMTDSAVKPVKNQDSITSISHKNNGKWPGVKPLKFQGSIKGFIKR